MWHCNLFTMNKFLKKIGSTVWNHGNIVVISKVDDGWLGKHGSPVEIYFGSNKTPINSRVDRNSPPARIYLTVPGIRWVRDNAAIGNYLTIEVFGPNKIRINSIETKKEAW
jgi:hypothetical protein